MIIGGYLQLASREIPAFLLAESLYRNFNDSAPITEINLSVN